MVNCTMFVSVPLVKKIIFMDELSNVDLDRLGPKLLGSIYRGAISKDEIPTNTSDGVYVVNMQSTGQKTHDGRSGGTHWAGLLRNKGTSFYFDSFGFPPPIEVSDAETKESSYFAHQVQPLKSILCGYYVLYVMWKISKGAQVKPATGKANVYVSGSPLFSNNTTTNDHTIHLFAESLK